jgi:hypothetical protein
MSFSDAIEAQGYTALSYPLQSAVELAKDAGFIPSPPPDGREYTLQDRQTNSEYVLALYCSAERPGLNPDRTEYIRLDEFCLSPEHGGDSDVNAVRDMELAWGTRIWTIPEILHAQNVLGMTRQYGEQTVMTRIFPTSGPEFREESR